MGAILQFFWGGFGAATIATEPDIVCGTMQLLNATEGRIRAHDHATGKIRLHNAAQGKTKLVNTINGTLRLRDCC